MLQEKLNALKFFAIQHKEALIKVGAIVLGGLVGAGVATLVANVQNEELTEEELLGAETEEDAAEENDEEA